MTTRARVTTMLVLGLAAGVVAGVTAGSVYAPLVGWDVAAGGFVISVWFAIWRMDAQDTADHATRENPGRATSAVILLLAAVASLAAVGVVVAHAHTERGTSSDLIAALAVVSVALSWFTVHTMFTLRYAELYYFGKPEGVAFKQDLAPSYADFAYVAFTVGMTFQVSDTDITTPRFRRAVLAHGLLSYLFGTVILASMINLIVGLGTNGG